MEYERKSLENFEHRYTISNKGRIYDVLKKKFLRPRITQREKKEQPAYIVALYTHDGKRTTIRLANTVAKHFCKNPNDYTNVYHKDGNIQNNNAWNLIYLAPDVHYWAVQLKRGKVKRQSILKGGIAKTFERSMAIQAIMKLKNKGLEEEYLLKYYETGDIIHLWDIYKSLENKIYSKAKSRINEEDAFDVMMDSWFYFIACAKRNTVQNYCFKTWLNALEYKAIDYWKENVKMVYSDNPYQSITPRHSVELLDEL